MKKLIKLDFGDFVLDAELFDTPIAEAFTENLPYSIKLTRWGDELYGPVEHNLGSEDPVPDIPPGGIAYTDNGNFICFFFGQTPAWSVEYIGQIIGDSWVRLNDCDSNSTVTISGS